MQTITQKSEKVENSPSLFDYSIHDNDIIVNFSTSLCGIDTLEALAREGAEFVQLGAGKSPIKEEWNKLDKGESCAAVTRYLTSFSERHVGLTLGTRFVVFDLDYNFQTQIKKLGNSANTWVSFRPEAPTKGALIYRIADKCPLKQSWKSEGAKGLEVELHGITEGGKYTQKAVAGGTYHLDLQHNLKAVTFDELETIWAVLTGTRFKESEAQRPHSKFGVEFEENHAPIPRKPIHDREVPKRELFARGRSVIDRLKEAVTPYDVFELKGMANDIEDYDSEQLRLKGNGGLIVGKPEGRKREIWHNFSDGARGNVLHAWAYVQGYDREDYKKIIPEVCAQFNVEYSEPATAIVGGNEVTVNEILTACLEASNSIRFEGRSKEYQRDILRGVLLILRRQDSLAGPVSQRMLSDTVGASRPTVIKWLPKIEEYVYQLEKGMGIGANVWTINENWLETVVKNSLLPNSLPNNTSAARGRLLCLVKEKGVMGDLTDEKGESLPLQPVSSEDMQRDIYQRPSILPKFQRSIAHSKPENGEWIENYSDKANRIHGLSKLAHAQVEDNSEKVLRPITKTGKRLIELLDARGPLNLTECKEALGVKGKNVVGDIRRRMVQDVERLADLLGREDIQPLLVEERRGRKGVYLSLPDDYRERLEKVEEFLVNDGADRRRKIATNKERIESLKRMLTNTVTAHEREKLIKSLDSALEWGRILTEEKGA